MDFLSGQKSFKTKEIIDNWHMYLDSSGNQWITWVRYYIFIAALKLVIIPSNKSWLIQCLTKYNKSKVFKEPVRSLMACIHIQLIHCRRCHSRLNYEKNFKHIVSLEQGQKVSNPFFKGTLLLQFS